MAPVKPINYWLFLPALFLSILSLVTLFSIAPDFFRSQLVFLIISLIIFLLVSQTDPTFFIEFSNIGYLLSLLLLAATLLIGITTKGAARWLGIGQFRFQPSEIIKPLLILFFSKFIGHLDLKKLEGFVKSIVILLMPLLLVFLQPDLGSSLVILAIWLGIILAKGVSSKIVFINASIFLLILPLIWNILAPYQKDRITHFLNPGKDPQGAGYSQVQSKISIGSGSLWGKGLGQGTQSVLKFLPEYQTDFIFAAFAEEWGFVGLIVLLGFYFILFSRLLLLASQKKREQSLVIIGVFTFLFFQFFIHSAMNLGILPITGITLPFVSAGGSSLLASWAALGIATAMKRN